MINVIVQEDWYSLRQCEKNPQTLYVFGDNTEETGSGGQAQIRYASNSIGIPTKRKPSMSEDSFFDDSIVQFLKVEQAISNILAELLKGAYTTIVFPADGLGSGLSKMPEKSPILFDYIQDRLHDTLGVTFDKVPNATY